jgi:hypothetical protein
MSGTIAGALPRVAGSITAYADPTGVIAGGLPSIAGALTGTSHPAGLLSGSLPRIGASMAGFALASGALSGSLPAIRGHLSGGPVVAGALAGALPAITGRLTDGPVATISGALPSIGGSATGYVGTAAAGRWLYLHTTPPAQVYSIDAIRGRLNPYLPSHRVEWSASDMRSEVGRVNDSWSATLTGAGATLRNRLALQAPYGVRVDLYDGGTLIRSGITTGIGWESRSVSIDVQSDIWTRDIPLRTSADLGTFRDVETLPRRYGRNVPGKLISINQQRTLWLWADHASALIRSVTIDGQPMDGWTWRNQADANGLPITVVQTVDPVDDGAQLVAVGDGALDAESGALLANPADVARDLCALAGITVNRSDFAGYRSECLDRNLELSGSITGGSLQAAMQTIAESTHSAFARLLPGYLRLLPLTAEPVATIPADAVISATQDSGDIATRLRVRYGVEESGPRRSLEVRASAIELAHGSTLAEVTLPLIRDDRSAADVASRMLGMLARPAYEIRCREQLREWLPGQSATVTVQQLGITGDAMVQSAQIGAGKSTPTLLLHAGDAPDVSLITLAQAYTPQPYAGASVATQGNERVVTITDEAGRAIAGAACTLDGSMTRTTDGAGRVSFPASAMQTGAHTIDVIASGFAPFRLTVNV